MGGTTQREPLLLHTGNLTWGLDPESFFKEEPDEIRDPGRAICPIFSRVPPRARKLLDLLMAGFGGPADSPFWKLIDRYKELDGRMTCRNSPLQGRVGVHLMTAAAILCLREVPPIVLEIEVGAIDLREQVPWKERAGFSEVLAWAAHRYGGVSHAQLTETYLFGHLSEACTSCYELLLHGMRLGDESDQAGIGRAPSLRSLDDHLHLQSSAPEAGWNREN